LRQIANLARSRVAENNSGAHRPQASRSGARMVKKLKLSKRR
jgi:hypothetical protein